MRINIKLISAIALALSSAAATAADAPSLKGLLEASGVSVTGHAAASYYHLSTDKGYFHQFDIDHNTFSLDQAALTIAYQPDEGFGALAMAMIGEDAKVLTLLGDNPPTAGSVAIPQAFVQYKTGGFTLMAGKMLTLAGAEVIAASGNTNFSRGLLFTNLEPLFHTGVRASYAVNDMVSITLGANNGWNNALDTTSQNTQKTFEAGVSIAPVSGLTLGLNVYAGDESPGGALGATTLIDAVVSWSATETLGFVLNYDKKSEKDVPGIGTVSADGLALYTNLALNDAWRVSLRLEQLNDDDGMVTGNADEEIKDITLTVGYAPSENAEVRFEVRQDKADNEIFSEPDGSATDKQTAYAVQLLYKF